MKYFIVFLLCFFRFGGFRAGAKSDADSPDEPLEICGWLARMEKKRETFHRARQCADKQGQAAVAAEMLTAHYTEDKSAGMQIREVEAEGNVEIRSQSSTAYGQKVVYDIVNGKAMMTGDNLRMESADQVVTARDRFEYEVKEGRLFAIGGAKVVRAQDTLEADTISAVMKEDAQGKRILNTLEATGHVVITTPAETVTGGYGIYRAAANKAELTGGVEIKRGPNTLKGERAEVDLATNTSQIFGGGASGQKQRFPRRFLSG